MRMATLARDALENTLNFLFTKVVVHVLLPERHDVEAATRVVRAHAARFFSSSEGPGRVPLGLRGLVSLLLMLALSGLPLALVAFSPAAWFPSISIASIRKLVRRPYRATDRDTECTCKAPLLITLPCAHRSTRLRALFVRDATPNRFFLLGLFIAWLSSLPALRRRSQAPSRCADRGRYPRRPGWRTCR